MVLKKTNNRFIPYLIGSVCGMINGAFGGGGGSVLVPSLEHFLSFDAKRSHATAIAVVLPVSIISAVTYIINGNVDFSVALASALGASAGAPLGALLLKKITSDLLVTVFSLITFAMGLYLLLR